MALASNSLSRQTPVYVPLHAQIGSQDPQAVATLPQSVLSALAAPAAHTTQNRQNCLESDKSKIVAAIQHIDTIIRYFESMQKCDPSLRPRYIDLITRTLNLGINSQHTFIRPLLMCLECGLGEKLSGFQFTNENQALVYQVKTPLGKPLIKELKKHLEKHLEKTDSIIKTNDFINFYVADLSERDLIALIRNSSDEYIQLLHRSFCLDLPNFDIHRLARTISQPTVKARVLELASNFIDEQMHILRSEEFNSLSILPLQANEDFESYNLGVKVNQLQELQRLFETNAIEEIAPFFQSLDPDLKAAFCEIVWVIDGKPLGNPRYGEDAILHDPQILLKTVNEQGLNVIEQVMRLCIIKRGVLPELHLGNKIHEILSKDGALTESDRLECLRLIDTSEPLKAFCSKKIWERDRQRAHQEHDPDFGGWEYGASMLKKDPRTLLDEVLPEFITILQKTSKENVHEILSGFHTPSSNVNALRDRVNAAAIKSVALISCEFKGILSQGGLGEAVLGMAKGLKSLGMDVKMILPKYDVIPPSTALEKLAFRINGCAVHRCVVNDIECLLIENELFNVGMKEGKANSIYGGKDIPNGHDAHVKARFARFQNLAADLGKKLYDEKVVDLLHVQDSQTALVPLLLAKYYPEQWKQGQTPPVVFTFHNNLHGSQGRYGYGNHDELHSMSAIGLGMKERNSFTEGLEYADAATTVSAKFAEEAQSNGELGRDVGFAVRKAAYQGKLFDVLNGTSLSVDFDPKQNKVLKSWQLVESLDLPPGTEEVRPTLSIDVSEGLESAKEKCEQFFKEIDEALSTGKRVVLDLSYGLDDHPLYIYAKKRICKVQVAAFMEKYGHGKINPNQPLLLNIGRFDSFQKGIGKIPYFMEAAKRHGAQMISIGLDGESCKDIPSIKKVCTKYEKNGLILITDERVPGGIKWQMGHTDPSGKKVPGIGPILRAAADMGVFPSSFEPCGLVQGECFNFGCRVLATDTGGFHDTVFSTGDKANGWLFPRLEAWESDAQLQEIDQALQRAVETLHSQLYSESDLTKWQRIHAFHTQSKVIMREAKLAGWADRPSDGTLNPAEKIQHVYARAIEKAQKRGTYSLNLLERFS